MGLVCRVLEERGITTVSVVTGLDLTEQVLPPRALFVNHPMGNNFGAPNDKTTQNDILVQALDLTNSVQQGGEIHDYTTAWSRSFEYAPGGKRIAG